LNLHKLIFNTYFGGVSLLGLSIFFFHLLKFDFNLIYLYILWTAIFVIIELRPVSLDVKGQVSLAFALILAILMIYGTSFSIIVSAVGTALADIIGKRGWQKVIFNSSQYSISLLAAGTVYEKFISASVQFNVIDEHILPFIFAATTIVVINFLLVAIIVSLSYRMPLLDVIKMDVGMIALFLVSLAPMSLLMAILYTNKPWSIILILPPLALAHNGFENYLKLRKQTRSTMELLADAVDKRDPYTASHSARVAGYAQKIAKEMGLPYQQIEDISMAGRVHDLGKIGVKDFILQKNGRLTEEEYKEMQSHPQTGYNILSPLKMYKDVLLFVLYHHERIDGKGYPYGLDAKRIPLGARILAVADCFDAMTTDRPYRKAMSAEEAFKELINNSGSQFDPGVVQAFIRIWEKEQQQQYGES